MEHDKKVEFVATARVKVNHVHNAVGLLKQVQSALVLLPLNESIGAVVELGHHDRDFVFAHPQLFIIVFVESIVFVVS